MFIQALTIIIYATVVFKSRNLCFIGHFFFYELTRFLMSHDLHEQFISVYGAVYTCDFMYNLLYDFGFYFLHNVVSNTTNL
jgi:hypothetical protein